MKKIITLCTLAILGLFEINAQSNDKIEAAKKAQEVLQLTIDGNYSELIEDSYPSIFEIVSKEQLTDIFKDLFEGNELMSINFGKEIPKFEVSEVFEDENGKFAFAVYDTFMEFKFLNDEFFEAQKDGLLNTFKGQGMLVKDVGNKTFEITKPNTILILINDEKTDGKWQTLNYDEGNPMITQIIPSYIVGPLKEFQEQLNSK